MPAWENRVLRAALLLVLAVAGARTFAQDYPVTLRYLPRVEPGRQEGLAGEPKSADAIVLVSALADVTPVENLADWPSQFRLRFFLPAGESAPDISIRQLRSLTGYYMMDTVAPPKPWTPGVVNEFAWARDVVADVYNFQVPLGRQKEITKRNWLAGLGLVVSLGTTGPTANLQRVTVAPAVLTSATGPLNVVNYLFSFRTNAEATITGTILSSSDRPVYTSPRYPATSGSPFTVRWPAANQPEGWYRLVLDASLAGQPQLVVRFYHKRSLAIPNGA
jgi:hypothetical protein